MGQGLSFSITNQAIEVSGVSYPLAEVETITLQRSLISPGLGVVVVLVGVVCWVFGYLAWGMAWTLVGIAITLVGIFIVLLARSVYQVRLNRKAATPISLMFDDLGEARQVVAAFGAALDQQRAFANDQSHEREVGGM